MGDLQADVSPVGIQGQHNTVEERQLGRQNDGCKNYPVGAGRVHLFRHDHLDTASSSGSISGAMTGLTSSDTFPVSASKEVIKEIKGKETRFPSKDIVDLTADSSLKNVKRSAFATDSESPEFPAFKRWHCRTRRTHRLPILSSQRNLHQTTSEGIRPTLKSVPSRGWRSLRTSLPAGKMDTGSEKETLLQSEADDVLGDVRLKTGSLGASSSGREDTIRLLPKNKGILAHAAESHGREGEPSEAEIPVSGIIPTLRPVLRTSLPAGKTDTGSEKATLLQSQADDVLGDAQSNTGFLGASSSGREDTTRLLQKNKGILAYAVESHGREGEPSEAVSGIRPTVRSVSSRGWRSLRTSLPAGKTDTGSEKATLLQSQADDLGNAQLNTRFLGASSSGREDTTRLLPKNKGILAHAVESHGREGEATGRDCQVIGHSSSEPEGLLPSKRKRSSLIDPAKSRQRFRPPRMVSGHSASGSSFGGMQRPIEVDDWESPRSSGVNMDFEVPETARQIEQDEMLAKFLQEEYSLEAGGGSPSLDDAQLARMLQEEESAKSLQQRAQLSFDSTNTLAVQAAMREMQRVLPPVRPLSARPAASSSRMRILRNLHSRSNQHVMRGRQVGRRAVNASERLFHFPGGIDLDTRLEFLAAMETVSQGSFSTLAQVDRDFNENDYEMLLALDDTNHAGNGASYDRIQQLPVSVLKPTDVYEETCSICLETPVVDDVVRRLPCMHGFHQQCIDAWLERQANCPICKVNL